VFQGIFLKRLQCVRQFSDASKSEALMLALEVITMLLVAVAMSMALAHALEFPGKLRLDRQTYMAVQTIYYPGFTIGGVGEGLAVIATLALMLAVRHDSVAFWWCFSAFVAVFVMHLVFWFVTQPTNRYWMKNMNLNKAGTAFFNVEREGRVDSPAGGTTDWQKLRDRWEYSHLARAALSVIALITLTVAVAR